MSTKHALLIKTTVEHAAGRIKVIAGTGANSTKEAISLAAYAKVSARTRRCRWCRTTTNRPRKACTSTFRAIAEAVDLPVILYNVPAARLPIWQQRPRCVSPRCRHRRHQDATGDIARGSDLIRRLRLLEKAVASVSVSTAATTIPALALMAMGSDGVISVTANVAPKLMADMCRLALAGRFCGRTRRQRHVDAAAL